MKFLVAFIMVLGCGLQAGADASWRPGSGDIYSAFRSNAPHYWGWLKTQYSSVLNFKGVVVGDAHILNFGDIELANGGREYGLIDMDDGGEGSLVGDFVRFAVGNQLSPYRVTIEDLIKSYRYGLSGVQAIKPDVLKNALSKSNEDFVKRQARYIDKKTSGDRFNENAELQDLRSAPADVLSLYENSKSYFFEAMAGYRIYDAGYKIKESGGSQGLVRFWFLIGREESRYIVEFKLATAPAVAEYANQKNQIERFNQVAALYRPAGRVYGPYKYIDTGSAVFLMRSRLSPYLDFDPTKIETQNDIKDGQLMSLYIANLMGLKHAQQGLAASVLDGSGYQDVIFLMRTYFKIVQDLSQ